jgi:hypothetical protein
LCTWLQLLPPLAVQADRTTRCELRVAPRVCPSVAEQPYCWNSHKGEAMQNGVSVRSELDYRLRLEWHARTDLQREWDYMATIRRKDWNRFRRRDHRVEITDPFRAPTSVEKFPAKSGCAA